MWTSRCNAAVEKVDGPEIERNEEKDVICGLNYLSRKNCLGSEITLVSRLDPGYYGSLTSNQPILRAFLWGNMGQIIVAADATRRPPATTVSISA